MDPTEEQNFDLFRDILSTPLIAKSTPSPTRKKKSRGKKTGKSGVEAAKPSEDVPAPSTESMGDAAELGEFIDVCCYTLLS